MSKNPIARSTSHKLDGDNSSVDRLSSVICSEHEELLHQQHHSNQYYSRVSSPPEGELTAANSNVALHNGLCHTGSGTCMGQQKGQRGNHDKDEESGVFHIPLGFCARIYTRVFVLIIMSTLNFIIYFDRGCISGSLTAIQDDNKISPDGKLSDSRGGMIASVFMFGYMFTCPFFSSLDGIVRSKYIILVGMTV
uniref:Protein spinster 1 n=1 Tax=Lygus hesperus TaxID=30085 RepID=A0A0A9WI09_LYGHE